MTHHQEADDDDVDDVDDVDDGGGCWGTDSESDVCGCCEQEESQRAQQ